MNEKQLRRSLAVLPIGTVIKLTSLSARQIRYYETQELVFPERSEGNRRMYSLNDIDRLLEIKDYLNDGFNMEGIRKVYAMKKAQAAAEESQKLSDADVRRMLRKELLNSGGMLEDNLTKLPRRRI
ncbi:MerR family transcriptional regulator [Pediococcus argentinicus]|nr:MerR family transcriptional regulator [Pediococcus argentinicus]NKZ22313.1 MerR family transcriptional regulator [Pediococcus argentinicus]GEP19322.1 glutamine synthetase [Pediococcus argentinicus]